MSVPSNIIIFLILLVQYTVQFSAHISPTNITRDQYALLRIKSKLSDPKGHLEDWNTSRTVCEWRGVICGVKHHRVTALDISGMSLGGIISKELGNMSFLVSLSIGENYLTGTIPHELVHLRRLRILNLTQNSFSGHVPFWMGSLSTKLQYLFLKYNSFTGSIPPSLFNLTSLLVLSIGNNNLRGEIPHGIGNLKHLTFLEFENNHISGSIPTTIYNISSLQTFSVAKNNLSGSIPPDLCHYSPRLERIFLGLNQFKGQIPRSLYECSQLQIIGLAFNNLSGSIPDFFWNLTMLNYVELQGNNFSGRLSDEVGNLQQLETLVIFKNSFTGSIPNSISNCSKLVDFSISDNHFTGSSNNELSIFTSLSKCQHLKSIEMSSNPLNGFLPKSIGNFSSSLQLLNAQDCQINGIIPDEIGNLTNLRTLGLSYNSLIGFLPSAISGLKRLERIFLRGNKINGSIPDAICDLPSFGSLSLESNQITGEIPSCIGTMRSLRTIHLSENLLESSIPSSLWNLTDLLQLHLDSNRLTGSLPKEVGNLKVLFVLQLMENRLSGELPTSLENLVSLQVFLVSLNKLEGSIPESFGKMISLKYLDLSYNNFEGSIPESFGKLMSLNFLSLENNNLEGSIPYSLTQLQQLEYFNVSNNKLVGEIPNKGPFVTFDASSFVLNEALCGNSRYHVPPCLVKKSAIRSKRWVYVILGISSTLVVLSLAILVWKNKRSKQLPVAETNSLARMKRVSYYEILQATENFNEGNLLGRGSFGSVYKGILNDGSIVAIKVFNLQATGALKSFDAECEVLRNLRHRNLTKVITICSNNDDFKALVLEYISNGSLEKCLHLGSQFLDMLQRLNIMVDVAHALEYLHHGFSSTIVHRDIKPSNVLLDGDMTARLSDFGLTRFLNEDSFTYTNTLATLGYIAPEYGSEGLVSRAGDVYSFGILMIETFTKRKPSDEMFTGELSLKEWVQNYLVEDQLVQVIDSELLSEDEERLKQKMESLYSVIELALNCCADSPKERMNIKNVRDALLKIKLHYETSRLAERT